MIMNASYERNEKTTQRPNHFRISATAHSARHGLRMRWAGHRMCARSLADLIGQSLSAVRVVGLQQLSADKTGLRCSYRLSRRSGHGGCERRSVSGWWLRSRHRRGHLTESCGVPRGDGLVAGPGGTKTCAPRLNYLSCVPLGSRGTTPLCVNVELPVSAAKVIFAPRVAARASATP